MSEFLLGGKGKARIDFELVELCIVIFDHAGGCGGFGKLAQAYKQQQLFYQSRLSSKG